MKNLLTFCVIYLFLFFFVAVGCEGIMYAPPGEVDPSITQLPGEPIIYEVPTERPATPGDIAHTTTDVLDAATPAIDSGNFTADDAQRVTDAAAPIMNPLTAGWWSMGASLIVLAWREAESRKRRRIIQSIDDNAGTPRASEQVTTSLLRATARLAA